MNFHRTIDGATPRASHADLKRVVRNLTVATALTAASLSLASTVSVPAAHAFGLGDITGAAKKVGSAVKKGAKAYGGSIKDGAKNVGRSAKLIGKKAKSGAKKVGGIAKKGAKVVGKGAEAAARAHGKVAKNIADAHLGLTAEAVILSGGGVARTGLKAIGKYTEERRRALDMSDDDFRDLLDADRIGGALGRGAKKVGKVIIGRNKIGGSRPRPDKSKAENALADYMNRRGGIARKTGNRGRMTTGLAKDGRFLDKRARTPLKRVRKVQGIRLKDIKRRPITGRVNPPEGAGGKFHHGVPIKKRPIIGHDKSAAGNPLYGNPRKVRKVQGITKDNLKPRRTKDIPQTRDGKRPNRKPYWKKYRESPRATKTSLRRKTGRTNRKQIGNDKSVWGRPVYGKRRNMNTRRKFNDRSFKRSRQSTSNRFKRRSNHRSMKNRFKRRFDSRANRRGNRNRGRRG